MTYKEIHEAILEGKTVNWYSSIYEIDREKIWEPPNKYNKPSNIDGYGLVIWCIQNEHCGGLVYEDYGLKGCYIKGEHKQPRCKY